MQYRIGDRDPATGLYAVIWPDGSSTLNGLKIFNAAHQSGDVVLATQRSDGMLILDSAKAVESVSEIGKLGKFGEQPIGYLHGQVWNSEDNMILPVVSVKFAPGSPTSLAPNAGNFVVRIEIERPQPRDLPVKCELTGTAPSGDYSYTGLDTDKIAIIPAGLLFKDVTIAPTTNTPQVNETIVVKALSLSTYLIGSDNLAIATISGGLPIVAMTISFPFAELAIIKFQFDQPLGANLQMIIDGTAELEDQGNLPGGDGSAVFVTAFESSVPISDPGVEFFTNTSPFVISEFFLAGTSERSYYVSTSLYLGDVRTSTLQIRSSPDYDIAAGYVTMTLQVDGTGGGGGGS
jgi:hypothetical protein